MAFRVKYPMKTPRRLITVLRTPKARVMDVSMDTVINQLKKSININCRKGLAVTSM
jgi:hypothetical protein